MTWHKPTQQGFGDLDFSRWQGKPEPVKAKEKLPDAAPPVKPATTRRPLSTRREWRPGQLSPSDQQQWDRMQALKRHIQARMAAGVSYADALEEGKRKFWPEEYQGEAD